MLSKAIKSVYASVFFAASRNYIQTTANLLSEEKMAIVIQSLCGSEDNGFFFPTFSGSARSVNYYPIGHEKPGMALWSLHMAWANWWCGRRPDASFSPRYPKNVLQTSSLQSALSETQNIMYALNLRPENFKTSIDDGINIEKLSISDASSFRNIQYVASTWDMQNERLTPGAHGKGSKVITFAHILEYDTMPLAAILTRLLEICWQEMQCHVEIEFAVNMDVPHGQDIIFNLLQVRPITDYGENTGFDWETVKPIPPVPSYMPGKHWGPE